MKNIIFLTVLAFFVFFQVSAQIKLGGLKFPSSIKEAEQEVETATHSGSNNSSGSSSTSTGVQAQNTGAFNTSLTESEIISGLKEALTNGATKAATQLNQTDGFWQNLKVRIPFPEDCRHVAEKLRELGYGKKVDEFELTLNRAAEQAAKEAAPIFVNAIKQMNVNDAKNILLGGDTAATHYLRNTTYSGLYSAFIPHIKKALDQTLATRMWADLAKTYNRLPMVKKVSADLPAFTTNKALKGLFVIVADQEKSIRKDPIARTTDILKKVFGS